MNVLMIKNGKPKVFLKEKNKEYHRGKKMDFRILMMLYKNRKKMGRRLKPIVAN